MPVSPARVIERLRGRLPKGFFKRVDAAQARAAERGDVPDPEVGWVYSDTLDRVLDEYGGAIWANGKADAARGLAESQDAQDCHALIALAQWRHTRGMYDFDPVLADMLLESGVGEVPAAALARLPEYAPYLMLHGLRFQDLLVHGCWVTLSHRHSGLRILSIVAHHDQDRVTCLEVPLKDGITLTECVLGGIGLSAQAFDWTPEEIDEMYPAIEATVAFVQRVVGMALYLCSTEPDIQGVVKAPPSIQHDMARGRPVPPQADNMLSVGFKHGGVIRMWKQDLSQRASDSSGLGMPKAPHIRRAHWHLFWCGPGRTIPRVRWVAPVAVNVKNVDDLAVHVRPVEGNPADAR